MYSMFPLATNLLCVYKMTHTRSPKNVVFGPDSVEMTYISTGNIIAKGVVDHASKAYAFSHFMPYSNPVQTQLPFEVDKCIKTPLLPFANTYVLSNISDPCLYGEEYQHDIDIFLNLKRI